MDTHSPPHIKWIAHRGYPSRYPENTLLGFERAIAAGARYLETDIQLSADGVPMAFHDDCLDKLCGTSDGRGLHECSRKTLLAYSPYVPGRFANEFKGEPLLSLNTLLALLAKHPQVTCFVEVKAVAVDAHGEAGVLDAVLPRLDVLCEQVVLISYHLSLLQAAKRRGWNRVAPVLNDAAQLCAEEVVALAPEFLFISIADLPEHKPSTVAPIVCFECSDVVEAQRLAAWGVDYIETDAIGEVLGESV